MSVEVAGDTIRIVGNAPVEDAEPILAALHENPLRGIDLAQAGHLHSAVVQILLAARAPITGTPAYPFFVTYVLPLLDPGKGSA
jgi:hypothetical protein